MVLVDYQNDSGSLDEQQEFSPSTSHLPSPERPKRSSRMPGRFLHFVLFPVRAFRKSGGHDLSWRDGNVTGVGAASPGKT
ncbi:hypothetical protein M514_02333 [Trichuris suis]|uniref:Uncharacterized protein n=1 Tax=Trichuris suis TaxID=68888 RepID=A0A085MHG1_9BILA|nr:hypothetical protein M513_02333 [Trichuris suis]KFD66835.1 hypothetical protein M514_02333 [Trichuris suis]